MSYVHFQQKWLGAIFLTKADLLSMPAQPPKVRFMHRINLSCVTSDGTVSLFCPLSPLWMEEGDLPYGITLTGSRGHSYSVSV